MEFPTYLTRHTHAIDQSLEKYLTRFASANTQLNSAMSYSSLLGGKRIRPILVLATADSFGIDAHQAMPFACAIEFIHAYSLVHDDLPAMDDDALRRGQNTCHIEFDEATAILAGDALQTLAFQVAIDTGSTEFAHPNQLEILQTIAKAAGAQGMVGGQAIDLASVGKSINMHQLKQMHRLKTGALIEASVRIGALCSHTATAEDHQQLSNYAQAIGLGFQVQDDILDVVSDTQTLGKTQGADEALNKPTFPALIGLDASQAFLAELYQEAKSALESLSHLDTSQLAGIADFIVQRVR